MPIFEYRILKMIIACHISSMQNAVATSGLSAGITILAAIGAAVLLASFLQRF